MSWFIWWEHDFDIADVIVSGRVGTGLSRGLTMRPNYLALANPHKPTPTHASNQKEKMSFFFFWDHWHEKKNFEKTKKTELSILRENSK